MFKLPNVYGEQKMIIYALQGLLSLLKKHRALIPLISVSAAAFLLLPAGCSSLQPETAPYPAFPPEKTETSIEYEKPEKKTVISYSVEPSSPYRDSSGYTGLEYITREQEWSEIKSTLDKKASSPDEHERALQRVSPHGKLRIRIGRYDLMHANTRWYSYRGYDMKPSGGEKPFFSVQGREGIPNVKGRDGNWWNVVEIPLTREIESSINVIITDSKAGKDFFFTVTRHETAVKQPVQSVVKDIPDL